MAKKKLSHSVGEFLVLIAVEPVLGKDKANMLS